MDNRRTMKSIAEKGLLRKRKLKEQLIKDLKPIVDKALLKAVFGSNTGIEEKINKLSQRYRTFLISDYYERHVKKEIVKMIPKKSLSNSHDNIEIFLPLFPKDTEITVQIMLEFIEKEEEEDGTKDKRIKDLLKKRINEKGA
jgi:transposase